MTIVGTRKFKAREQAVTFGPRLPATACAASFPRHRGAGAAVRLGCLALDGEAVRSADTSPDLAAFRDIPPTNTHRKPMLLLRLSGVLLLRFEDNRLSGSLLFHDPPRNTREVCRCRRSNRAAKGQRQ